MDNATPETAAPASATPANESAAPAPAKTPPREPETLTSQPGEDAVAKTGDWPSDWRSKIAGDDADFLKELERFPDLQKLGKSWRDAQKKIRSGELKHQLPADATPEQLAEWRKQNGIPNDAKGYNVNLPNGKILGEQDQPHVASFTEAMHGLNAPDAVVNRALEWYFDFQENAKSELQQKDRGFRATAEEDLRDKWGVEYKGNLTAIKNMLDGAGVHDLLMTSRGGDGRLLGANPDVLQWLAGLSRELNPTGTIVPSDGQTTLKSIETRLEELAKLQRTDPKKYWGPETQDEERKLLAAQQRLKS